MNNIPHLAANLEKRAGKAESFDIIKRAINGENLKDHDWAVLYSYFLPPKSKKITNPWEWLCFVTDNNENYSFCKYVFVENGVSYAANTKSAHVVYSDFGLKDGWYDIKKGNAGSDIAIMPNVESAIKEASGNYHKFLNGEMFDIIEAPSEMAFVLPWNKKGVNKSYFETAYKSISGPVIEYNQNGPVKVAGKIKDIECVMVTMPFDLSGLVEKEPENIELNTIPTGNENHAKQLNF